MRAAVCMSGGVDSSLAALLLREQGHEVTGLTAWLWRCSTPEREGACCGSVEALRAAREAAEALGIGHEVVDLSEEFEREVVEPTARAYASGRTPNPCVLCNARVRFPLLAAAARDLGAEAVATGHYARTGPREGGGVRLLRGVDPGHDQSYFLFAVRAGDLAFARFPLGGWTKAEARSRMDAAGHPAARRASSQDLCFAAGRARTALVRSRRPEAARPGPIVDLEGNVLGAHGGLAAYTVGQRKGLGLAAGRPLYAVELRPETNELVVGPPEALDCSRFAVEGLRWLSPPPPRGELDALVQVRYRTRPARAKAILSGDGAEVLLEAPVRAVAPGQAAVFYDGDEVIAGGWIARRTG